MHHRSSCLNRVTTLRLGVICALCMLLFSAVRAEPVVLYDGNQPAGATTDTSKLVSVEPAAPPLDEVTAWPAAAIGAPGATPESGKPADLTRLPLPPAPALPERPEANDDPSLHSVIKEGVRPVYEQLVESGAVETWHELKADLGLNKNQWSEDQKTGAPGTGPGQWDAPGAQDPAQPPRTAAQAQLDREMATLTREKLIDQITPWLIGLVGLYVAGYLAKLLYGYVRWRSGKRNERRIARAKRRGARRSRSTTRAATGSASAPRANAESQETV